jgi:hypothetical protein
VSLLAEVAEPVAAPAARPGRRSRLPLLAALAVVTGLTGSLLMSAPRAASFAPLLPRVTGAPFVTIPEYGPAGAHVLGYEDGARVALTLPLRNTGRLPVTVTSVAVDAGVAPLLVLGAGAGLPVRLGPGASAEVVVAGRLTNCRFFHEREMQTLTGLRLGIRVLGRHGMHDVPFDRPVLVKSPMIVGCPDRKLNRQADNRTDLL